ncbi:MAG TPA: GntR family transcriptional regulator [Rhizobiaceae bacterium]
MRAAKKTVVSDRDARFSDGDGLRIERIRPSLRDQVLKVLRTAILELRFLPGDRLIERELCELVGVSRTSIREALRHLESEGLVRNIPNVGPTVAVIDVDEANHIYELREVLEMAAGRLFAGRATEAQLSALRKSLKSLATALGSGELKAIIRQTTSFYDVFLKGCGNPLILETIRSLQARLVLLRVSSMSMPGRAQHSLAEMEDIVAALERRDANAAAAACQVHIQRAREAAMKIIEKDLGVKA